MTRPLVILAIVAAIAAAILLKVIISVLRHVIRKHGAYLILWYVTGHHNGGKRACCEKHCTPAVRWRRARFRLSPLVLAIATVTMLAAGLAWLLAVPAGILAGIIVLYPRRAGRVGRVLATPVTKRVSIPAPTLALRPAARLSASAQHQREVVRPMAAALAPVLEMSPRQARKAITVPAGWREPGAELGITVRAGWSATLDRQQFIERETSQRLPGIEWGASYRLGGAPRRVLLTPLPEPPHVVPLERALAAIEAAQQGKPVTGIDSRGGTVSVDLDKETPHVGLSIGTGGGKSDFLKVIIMQLITKGVERVVIIDPKGGSQKWAEDEIGRVIVPGIEIHYDLEDQWQAIEDFRNRMEADYKKWRSDRRVQFSREVLIMEEQNDFASESIAYWKRNKGRKDPSMPPPFDHAGRVLFKGRQANRNIFSVYQRMSVHATGGLGDMRDQYGTKIVGRFSPAAWDSLVGTRPRGKSSTIPGRMITITGPDHRVMQAPWATDAEALDYVFSHGLTRVAHPVSLPPVPGVEAGQTEDQRQSDSDTTPRERPVLTLVTSRRNLRQHADRETVPLSYKALSKRRQRDPGFPAGVNKTYTDDEIRDWYAASDDRADVKASSEGN